MARYYLERYLYAERKPFVRTLSFSHYIKTAFLTNDIQGSIPLKGFGVLHDGRIAAYVILKDP